MKTLANRQKRDEGNLDGAGRAPRKFLPIVLVAGVSATTPAWGEDFNRGRQLYENHCQACHSSLLHTPVKSRIKSFQELETRVSAWGVHAAKGWTEEEVRDVSYYLDRSFYHFGGRHE